MSGRGSKKNQRFGSSRRGPNGFNKNKEKKKDEDDDGFQQDTGPEDGRNEFHSSADYHSTQFDHPTSSSIDQQTSTLESPPHAGGHKDSLMETELPERKRKMGSTRKSTGRVKSERKLDEMRTTEELDEEYVTQPNTSTTEEQHKEEQSRPMSFPSDLSLQTKSSGLGKEPGTTLEFVVSENEEKDAIHRQEIASHSHEVVSDMPIDETPVHSFAITTESDLLREDSVMFDKPKTFSRQEIPTASTSGQKRRMGSTRRPLGGKNSENVGVQEHSRNMTKNERKAEVMSEEMVQTWDDVARDDPSPHAESSLVLNQSLLAERAELKELDISAGTETMNQSVAFPLVDSEKPLPETSSQQCTPLLSEGFDFKFGSHTEDFDVLNKVLKDTGRYLSDNSYVPDTRKDTNPSYNFRDVNTETKEEVLKQKEELSINDQMSSLLPKQDAQLEELALNDHEASLSQHDIATLHNNCNSSMPQLIVGGSTSFDVPLTNISHDEPTTTNLPHEMSDPVKERREIHTENEQGNNVCNVASVACDTLTDLESIMEEDEDPQILATRENENMSDERGSETENAFEMTDQDDAGDHSVTQIIMDVRDNEKDREIRTETIWISHQKQCEVSGEKEEIYREQVQYSSTVSQTHSSTQDDARKMLENDEVTKETENTAVTDVTSKSEEMFSFEDSAIDTGSHTHQLLMQSPDKEDYDLYENVNEKSEKEGILFSVESENTAFDRGDGRSEGAQGNKEVDAAPVVILDVDTNDRESENPEQSQVLTEEQTDTSSDTNLQVLEVSDNVCTMIDSGLLLHDVEVVNSVEESGISSFIHKDSQYSYKPATYHPESQENTGDAERVAVGGDTDLHLEMRAQNKTFDSTTSEADGTEENIHDASVLVRETVTVESYMTTKLDFLQTSPDAHMETLKVSENAEKEVSGEKDTILKHSDRIIAADHPSPHGEEAHSKSSPTIHRRKMGSTRRPQRGKIGQRKEHDEREIFNLEDEPSTDASTLRSSKDEAKGHEMENSEKNDVGPVERSESTDLQSLCSSDLVPEESTAIGICHVTESQTLTKINEVSQEKAGDLERAAAGEDKDLQLEIDSQNKMFKSTTSEPEGTEENIQDVHVTLVREVEVIGDTVTVESNMTTESDFLQTSPDAHIENAEKEVSGKTDTILVQSDISIIPADSHREETHSKSSPVIHKRKMGSTRRPLRGNKGQRKEIEHHDENETLDSDGTINVEKETVSLENELRTDQSTLQSLKDGAKEQEMEKSEKNDVGHVEGSESALLQSSCSSDSVSEESTAISICHILESQTLTKIHVESREIDGDAERVAAGGDADLHLEITAQNKTVEPTNEPEGTEKNIQDASILVREAEVIGNTGTLESNVTTESDFLQSSPDAHKEASKNAERVAAEEDKDLELTTGSQNQTFDLTTSEAEGTEENIQDVRVTLVRKVEVIEDTVTVESNMTSESDFLQTSPDAHIEALEISENAEKEVSGKTDTILEQSDISIIPADSHREETHSESSPVIHKRKMGSTRRPLRGNTGRRKDHDEKEILEDEPSPDQSAYTAVSICDISDSQTLRQIHAGSQENTGDAETVPVEQDKDLQLKTDSQNKRFDLTTSEPDQNIQDVSVMLVREVEFIGDTVSVDSNMTTKSDLIQSYTSFEAKLEASGNAEHEVLDEADAILKQSDTTIIPEDPQRETLKVFENVEKEVSGETDTILKQSGINIIPEDTHREEAHSKSSPFVHKRKMGSTRRPLRGDKGQRKETEHQDENEPPDNDGMINVEKETISLENNPSPYESTLQISKDEAKEHEIEISEKNDVGPVEGSESTLLQSSFRSDSASEESTAISICHITESQTLTKINEESQENVGDAERAAVGEDADLHLEIAAQHKTGSTTSEAEGTEENIRDASVLVREVEIIGDMVTVESNMTTELHFLQTSPDADKALKSEDTEVSGGRDTILEQSDIRTIPADSHGEEAHSKSSPVVHKRKMGSTRRPLKGKKGQRQEHNEKEIFNLEEEPSSDESRHSRHVVSDISESQTLTTIHAESQENTGDVEIVPAGGDTEPHLDKTFDSTAFEVTEENICETSALVKEVKFIGDTVIVESNMTTESDFIQNDNSSEAKLEPLKLSDSAEHEVLEETDTIPKQSDTTIIPEDTQREEAHSELHPVVHKRKMGSTRRALRGNKGQRKVGVESKEKNGDSEGLLEDKDSAGAVQELCDDLELEQRSDVSQTQTGPSQDNTGSHALLMEETQIHFSYDDFPPTDVAELLPVSTMSVQKRKMGSTRKRGKRMVNEEEAEEEKKGEDENTIDDGTKSEKKSTLEEGITGSPVLQQLCSSSADKESHDIQDIVSKSDVQTEISKQSDPNSTMNPKLLIESECSSKAGTEMVSDLPLGDVETYLVPKQSVIPKESHRDQSNLNPVVQKRKMGSTRKTLRGNKGQGREVESKKMERDIEGMTQEQDTEPHLTTSARKTESKFDEVVEQNFLVAASNMFPETEVKEVSQNIHDLSEVSEEKELEHTGNDSNSINEATNLYEGTKDTFVLTVSHEDVHHTMSADYLDKHVYGGSEPEQTENTQHVIPTQELKNTQDDVHEISSQKIPATQEKRRKMGSTRRNPRVMHGKNMADHEDTLGMTEDRETKKAEDDLDDMPLALSITQDVSSISTTDLESETLVSATDLKGENDHQNSSEPSEPTVPETPENTLQICANQSETTEKRRKMGSTRKNLREGRTRGKGDGYEDTETADSKISLVREDEGEQTTHDQSENSLLSEIESALNKSSQSTLSCDWELIVKEPNPDDLANAPVLNMPENSEIKSLQPTPSAHSEPNSPGRRRRKMGSTRKNPRQELKAETDDENKEDGEIDENLKTNKQEKKDLERVEASVVHNITENKEYLDVSSAHTSSSQQEESTNTVSQEGTSPSTKRKFGSRRANKGKQGLGRKELEDGDHKPDSTEVEDLAVCDPENQPITHPVSEQRNMEAKNKEAGAGLVSFDQKIKHDRSTGAKQTVNLKNTNAEVVQFNIVMVGNSCVGKTSFVRRFHEGQFTEDYRSTIGVDTFVQTIALPDRIVKLQIWDTAGQERFHSITTQVFRNADGLLLMYEITSSNSFTSVRDWITQAQEKAPDDAIMMLLGNKNDSVERKVQIQEGADLAREYNIHFMECSAATGENVSESMRTLAELLAQRKTQREKHTTLRREPPQKKSGCC